MDEPESPELSQRPTTCNVCERSWWNRPFSSRVSFGIAVGAVLAYWGVGSIVVCVGSEDSLPPALWFALYFAHYSALGGLVAAVISITIKKGSHAVLWGAIAGAILAALLMT